jgi:hypothetical protein
MEVNTEYWREENADTREILTPELRGHQSFTDIRALRTPESLWHPESADSEGRR